MAIKRKKQKLVITLDNVSQADAIALIKMFKYAQHLGNIGSSRMCAFFADGDGSFHPKFSYEYPEDLPDVPEIAWKIYHDLEPENYVKPPHSTDNRIFPKKI